MCRCWLQARLAGELEQHRLRLSTAFDSLDSAILDAKSLAAAACKPVSHRHKVLLLLLLLLLLIVLTLCALTAVSTLAAVNMCNRPLSCVMRSDCWYTDF